MESIDITNRIFEFAKRIVRLCQNLEEKGGISRTLQNQLLRSGTSIGANVEEAQAGQSKADFVSKIYIACKEARETKYWLRLLVATEIVSSHKLESLIKEANVPRPMIDTQAKRRHSSPSSQRSRNRPRPLIRNRIPHFKFSIPHSNRRSRHRGIADWPHRNSLGGCLDRLNYSLWCLSRPREIRAAPTLIAWQPPLEI